MRSKSGLSSLAAMWYTCTGTTRPRASSTTNWTATVLRHLETTLTVKHLPCDRRQLSCHSRVPARCRPLTRRRSPTEHVPTQIHRLKLVQRPRGKVLPRSEDHRARADLAPRVEDGFAREGLLVRLEHELAREGRDERRRRRGRVHRRAQLGKVHTWAGCGVGERRRDQTHALAF